MLEFMEFGLYRPKFTLAKTKLANCKLVVMRIMGSQRSDSCFNSLHLLAIHDSIHNSSASLRETLAVGGDSTGCGGVKQPTI